MKRDTIVVFGRVPRLGTVKRRLAAEIGERAALRFHTGTMMRLLRRLAADRRFCTMLAATPDRARLPLPPRVVRMPQTHGNLGRRMSAVFRRLPRRRVAIIGCDIPVAGPADVEACFRALGSAEAVFGPAEDGGYWLIGLGARRPALPFANVRWSTEEALAGTIANLRGRHIALLRRLHDVDTAADWQKLHGLDARSPETLAKQRCACPT